MPRSTTTSLPSAEAQKRITDRLSDLVSAIEAHPQFKTPQPHRSLYYIWDFVQRSRYVMTELDNIAAGRPLQYPEQLKGMLKEGQRLLPGLIVVIWRKLTSLLQGKVVPRLRPAVTRMYALGR